MPPYDRSEAGNMFQSPMSGDIKRRPVGVAQTKWAAKLVKLQFSVNCLLNG